MSEKDKKLADESEFEVSGPPTQLDHRIDPAEIPSDIRARVFGLLGRVTEEDATNLNVCPVSDDEDEDVRVPTDRVPIGLDVPLSEERTQLDVVASTDDLPKTGRTRAARTRGGLRSSTQQASDESSTAPSISALLDPMDEDNPTYRVMPAFDSRRQSQEIELLSGPCGEVKDTTKERAVPPIPPPQQKKREPALTRPKALTNPLIDPPEMPDVPKADRLPPEPWSDVAPRVSDARAPEARPAFANDDSGEAPKIARRRLDKGGQQRSADIIYSNAAPAVQQHRMTEPMTADPYRHLERPRLQATPSLTQWFPIVVVILLGLWVALSLVAFIKSAGSNTPALAAVLSVGAVVLVIIATKVAQLSTALRGVAHVVIGAGLSGLAIVSFSVDVLDHISQILLLIVSGLLMLGSAFGEFTAQRTHRR